MSLNVQKKNKVPYASRDEYIAVIAFAGLHMIALALLVAYSVLQPVPAVILSVLSFFVEVILLAFIRRKRTGVVPRSDVHSIVTHALGGMLKNTKYPIFILDMSYITTRPSRLIIPFNII